MSQALLLVIYAISFYVMVKYHATISRNPYLRAVNLLLIMFTVYGLMSVALYGAVVHHVPASEYFKRSYSSLLPIYVCYIYTKKGYLSIRIMQIWMVIMLVVGILAYHRTQAENLANLMTGKETTNNSSYVLLALIPGMMLFHKKPVFLFLGVGVCSFYVLMGMKRGAVLIDAILIAMIVNHLLKSSKGALYRFLTIISIIVGIVLLSNMIDNLLENSDFFNRRILQTQEGDTSQRDYLYSGLWDVFVNKSNVFNQIVGHGAWGTRKTFHAEAHNDWLQLLIDNGVLGIILFVNYWFHFFKESRSSKRTELSRFCLFLVFLLFFIKSFYSMSIMSMSIFATFFLGYCLADGFAEEMNKKYKQIKA